MVKKKVSFFTKQVLEKMVTLVTAAFGLVAALAWNDAIKALFIDLYGSASGTVPLMMYALIVTIAAVFITIYLGRLAQKAK